MSKYHRGARTEDIIATVRWHVGRRRKIGRQEMADILTDLAATEGMDLRNDCMSHVYEWEPGQDGHGRLIGGRRWINPPKEMADIKDQDLVAVAPCIWANACTDITCISVSARGNTSRDPLMFVSCDMEGDEWDPIGQMRVKAGRVLVVSGDDLRIQKPGPEQKNKAAADALAAFDALHPELME